MSDAVQKRVRKPSEDETLLALLREYSAKFNTLAGIGCPNGKHETVSGETFHDLVTSLLEPARDLARHVSQRIEHARLDPLVLLEMRLRLAEFEGAMQAAEEVALNKRESER